MSEIGDADPARVLLIEDEYLIAADMVRAMTAQGMKVVGPAGTIDGAMALIKAESRIDGAVLDVNLHGEMVFEVADALVERGVPFVFATGYNETVVPPRFFGVPRCEKPVEPVRILKTLFKLPADAVPR